MITAKANPYVGLRPFETDESLLFFGRNDQTLELLQRLHRYHFVAVVGSSGCGKSSLLRAGLIPALKAGYLVDDSDQWLVAIMKPGHSPLYNLAEAMLQLVYPNPDSSHTTAIVDQIKEEGADVILNLLDNVVKDGKHNIFLLVDQFEELFRFSMDQNDAAKKDEAIDFVNIMLELAFQKEMPVYVVMTMRSDFIGDCARFYGLPEAMNQSQYLVPRLNRTQLKTVIEGPAKLYGGKLNSALTSFLLNELGKVKDELPLLQHALMRIWDFEMKEDKNDELDLEDYKQIGGIEKALSNHADEAVKGMTDEELNITKEMFQALTAIDESGRKIRRPVLLSQLKESLTGATEEKLLQIIERFIQDNRCFLIKNSTGKAGEKIIDISHETLIRQWDTLSKWVDEEGEHASVYLQLAEAYKFKKLQKRDYLSGTELDIALEWFNNFKPTATWANRYRDGFDETIAYLKESERIKLEREAEIAAKQRQEEERLLAEQEAGRQEKKRRLKMRILSAGIVVLFIIIFLVFLLVIKSRQGEIVAKNAQAEANAAEQKTKELLQIVLVGRGQEYNQKSYDQIVDMLRRQQTYPIDSLIIPRAVANKPNVNSNNYSFLMWVEVPSFRRDEIKEVQYELCEGFIERTRVSREPSSGFAIGYLGWGYCPIVRINVVLVNGRNIKINFRLGDYINNNPQQ